MLGSFTALLVNAGLSEARAARLSKVAAIALLVVALFVGAIIAKALYDNRLIARHDAIQQAEDIAATRKADSQAATERRADDARLSAESHALEKATADAPSDPAAARRAYYDCVRLQQHARQHRLPAPAC